MLFRGFTTAVLLTVGVMVATFTVLRDTKPPSFGMNTARANPTLALAPMSLGNPTTAALLRTTRASRPQDAPPATPDESPDFEQILQVGRGDTLMALLIDAGLEPVEAQEVVDALSKIYNPRRIRPGQEIQVRFQIAPEGYGPGRFLSLTMVPDPERRVTVSRTDDDRFQADEVLLPLTHELARASGEIESNLYTSGVEAGMPRELMAELIRVFSWDVDFQRDIRSGDAFDVAYEHYLDEDGNTVRSGNLLYASLTLSGKTHMVYRHTTQDGDTGYFDDRGRSARKALLRTPIDGARLSSGFGKRRHPVLGYTRMHKGVDFGAPTGTPIYAAGNGTVDFAGRKGGYGNYLMIRHNSDYTTAYGHLSRYGKGIRKGQRVKQGDVVGYVGTTGVSTGPHLHFEILVKGDHVNPLKVKVEVGDVLKGKELVRFMNAKERLDVRVAGIEVPVLVAKEDGK